MSERDFLQLLEFDALVSTRVKERFQTGRERKKEKVRARAREREKEREREGSGKSAEGIFISR